MTEMADDDWSFLGDLIDMGHGASYVWTSWNGHEHSGLIEVHPIQGRSGRHAGSIMFDVPGASEAFPNRPLWTKVSEEPLTVTPSILCSCGWHGHITNGRWEPC